MTRSGGGMEPLGPPTSPGVGAIAALWLAIGTFLVVLEGNGGDPIAALLGFGLVALVLLAAAATIAAGLVVLCWIGWLLNRKGPP